MEGVDVLDVVDALAHAHLLGEAQLHVRHSRIAGEDPPGAVDVGAEVRDPLHVRRGDCLHLGDLAGAGGATVALAAHLSAVVGHLLWGQAKPFRKRRSRISSVLFSRAAGDSG